MPKPMHCGADVPPGPVIAYATRLSDQHSIGFRLACPHCWAVIRQRRYSTKYIMSQIAHALPCGAWVSVDVSKPSTNGTGPYVLELVTPPEP